MRDWGAAEPPSVTVDAWRSGPPVKRLDHSVGQTNAPAINPVTHSHHAVFGFNAAGTMTNLDLTTYEKKSSAQTGGECVSCHMPTTTYMQRHARHDHGFTIPDPLLTK